MNLKVVTTFLVIFYSSLTIFSWASNNRVSVITVDPGTDIYTVFGHTAIRITDSLHKADYVYNFGTFNFNDPFFCLKFIRGSLKYSLSISSYTDFMAFVRTENRTASEQVISLSIVDKEMLERKLINCYASDCRYYVYDFFNDNCATRVRDYIFQNSKYSQVNNMPCCKTYRQLLHPFINHHYWLLLGIDLALGREADQKVKPEDYMFLPFYIPDYLRQAGLVSSETVLFSASEAGKVQHEFSKLTPWIIIMLVFLFYYFHKTRRFTFRIYTLVFAITGIILLSISAISFNKALTHNLNIWWTLPAIFILLFSRDKTGIAVKTGYLILLTVMVICKNHFTQQITVSLIPWIIGMMVLLISEILAAIKKLCLFNGSQSAC